MTQPDYVPATAADRVRPVERLPFPGRWFPSRPADSHAPVPPKGPRFGSTGPDLGYGMSLARRFEDRLDLVEGESANDAIVGCFAVGSRRAAAFGRAPVIYDMEFAFTLWGFLGGAPQELLALRTPLFRGAAHDYELQRDVVDRVKESALPFTPAQVRDRLSEWNSLIVDTPIVRTVLDQ
jgi:alkanesulfonate monooxygenase SsuD/methylene tetrahydromethanopterin reductase-like flavin-dependent oxidoreductase (luciferase family)